MKIEILSQKKPPICSRRDQVTIFKNQTKTDNPGHQKNNQIGGKRNKFPKDFIDVNGRRAQNLLCITCHPQPKSHHRQHTAHTQPGLGHKESQINTRNQS
eukprot:Lithocolla_globosa_v1_NODE_3370_length_1689_cov_2.134639.p2 type:complete len:100 gc:universal NODE_3370_length_1689_cov_2.134639:1368-1667(+)